MQTAIHFEGDQAYICVSDHGKIKEEEPVSYGRSRVEFVIQTAKAQEEGKIAVVFDDATGKIVKDADIVYKLKIQGEYIKADQCKIKITDLGFGKIRPASYQTWQQIIYLERGDYNE